MGSIITKILDQYEDLIFELEPQIAAAKAGGNFAEAGRLEQILADRHPKRGPINHLRFIVPVI